MGLKKALFLLFLIQSVWGISQVPQLSPLSKISILTSGPGDILYSAFGHSAIRVQDQTQGIDVVYNYGIFDTSGENFYLKFAKGRMDYKLERWPFTPYLKSYEIENRWVKEQLLDLSVGEKNALFKFLEHNNLPENKVYQYDYFLNNCATKIWHVLEQALGPPLVFNENYLSEQFSFRQLIHQNIATNSWGAFGIDIALGSVIDRKATPKEHLYLPNYVMEQLKVATLNDQPLVKEENVLAKEGAIPDKPSFISSPLFLFLVLSVIIILITYKDWKQGRPTKWLDFVLFLLTGFAGLNLAFLWFFTDHIWTVANFNILWAFPLNLVIAFFVLRNPGQWFRKYLFLLMGLLVLLVILWIFRVQGFSPVLIPFLLALEIRYFYLTVALSPKKIAAQ